MGFQRGRVILEWPEDHELHGLEVVCKRQTLGEALAEWADDDVDAAAWDALTRDQRAERTRRNAAKIADLIVEWNFEDAKGQPVKPTAAGVLAHCDGLMISEMRTAYNTAISRVAPPLPTSSGPGPGASSTEPPETENWDMAEMQEALPAG